MIHKISSNIIVYFAYRPFECAFVLKTYLLEESVTFHIFPSHIDGVPRRSKAFLLFRGLVARWLGEKKKSR